MNVALGQAPFTRPADGEIRGIDRQQRTIFANGRIQEQRLSATQKEGKAREVPHFAVEQAELHRRRPKRLKTPNVSPYFRTRVLSSANDDVAFM